MGPGYPEQYLCVVKINENMANTILHKADTRGHADHGWLVSHQSFSFADYFNPERMQFGMLRVLNDDFVAGGRGFGSHPHDNMEIISIPLEGSLVHEDNLGHRQVVSQGEIQVMSTGKGVFHSEYNNSLDQPAKFLQIWVFPNRLNVEPRYDQVRLDPEKGRNRLQQVLSPGPGGENDREGGADGEGSWIYQDAWFYMGRWDAGREFTYELKKKGNGIYFFVISGSFAIDEQPLEARDGLGITDRETVTLRSQEAHSQILVMEVPMQNKI
jgi:redox-sensitive bicupin YhaK (pirin superfamily)